MFFIDSHTHLYLEQFDTDRTQVVEKAVNEDVEIMLLPNIDKDSIDDMMALCAEFPDYCFPMMGLHPTSVGENYEEELAIVENHLKQHPFVAIGETGIDLYWDKTFKAQQEDAFRRQLMLAKKFNLPVSIHTRDSFDKVYGIVKEEHTGSLRGVFHCFTGTSEQAEKIMEIGFFMGIGGVLTFKNSGLGQVLKDIPLDFLLLETDSPFLTPVPYRGKRNESAYIRYIANKLAEVKEFKIEEIAEKTSDNALRLFNLKKKR